MKVIKAFIYFILGIIALFCILVFVCAFNPKVSEKIADFLYREKKEEILSVPAQDAAGVPAVILPEAESDVTGVAEPEGIVADIYPAGYTPPGREGIVIPETLAGRNGYEPIREESEQLEKAAAELIKSQLGVGSTGDGLSFDARFYPYYAMLDDKGQHLYRQIYANAKDLFVSFAPVEEVTAGQLRNVFCAVYNDHPELFWLDTSYAYKYTQDGECVEIDLQFNRTAQNLDSATQAFTDNAALILQAAQNLESDYEKEKYVHDALIEKVSYNLGAEMNQSAYSALVNGQTVCAGYARAFQYLLQQLGIPCYYCTGFAGESHAWNITMLEDGYYNVDTTWDDTDGGNYDYFNKTDSDYRSTHIRQELSIYLPPCNGQRYREEEQSGQEEISLSSLADIGMTEEGLLHSLEEYYNDCYNQIVTGGSGDFTFYNVVDGDELLQQCDTAYRTDAYIQGYMEAAVLAVGAKSWEIYFDVEALKGNRYLIVHNVSINP